MKRACLSVVVMIFLFLAACGAPTPSPSPSPSPTPSPSPSPSPTPVSLKDPTGETVSARFFAPLGFERVVCDEGSFGAYLQALPLRSDGSKVYLFDGSVRAADVHAAVVKLEIGTTDVQQGTDALLRLRGEYLFAQGQKDKLSFHFYSGFVCDYAKWAEGYRVDVKGSKVSWVKKTDAKDDYESFRAYMSTLFVYANAKSLVTDTVQATDLQIGDVFLTGSTGVMVVDMATDAITGEQVFLLATGGTPAQEICILKNSKDPDISPWYSFGENTFFDTPEETYTKDGLRRFID